VNGDDPVELAPDVWQMRQPLSEEVPLYLHLVVGADGAALVDGGLPSSLPAVERLMAAAGVRDGDLRFLVNTHAHHEGHIRGASGRLGCRSGRDVMRRETVDRVRRDWTRTPTRCRR